MTVTKAIRVPAYAAYAAASCDRDKLDGALSADDKIKALVKYKNCKRLMNLWVVLILNIQVDYVFCGQRFNYWNALAPNRPNGTI